MVYNAVDVAKYVVTYCNQKNKPVSNLKLQKLMYYAWIDLYKETGNALFVDDICAWQIDPVVPDVYYEFCTYAGAPIVQEYDVDIASDDAIILNRIIEKHLNVSASTLVSRTHIQGGARDRVFRGGAGLCSVTPFSLIEDLECDS
jgi:uncharacterized phage-associated protein